MTYMNAVNQAALANNGGMLIKALSLRWKHYAGLPVGTVYKKEDELPSLIDDAALATNTRQWEKALEPFSNNEKVRVILLKEAED